MALNRLFASLIITPSLIGRRTVHISAVNLASKPPLVKPKPGFGKSYRRIVHFPEEYTVKPLEVTNLAGRDPETGRIVAKGIGGGIKHKYHWIDWYRNGPTEGPPQDEKVIQIMEDGCRTAHIALVAVGEKVKYILATENMKAGDILKTSRYLPRIPVRANEGDAYVLGALPVGTLVHCIEKEPGQCILHPAVSVEKPTLGEFENAALVELRVYHHQPLYIPTIGAQAFTSMLASIAQCGLAEYTILFGTIMSQGGLYVHAAGTHGTILRKQDDRVIVQMPSKRHFSFDQYCMAVVGRLSNVEHGNTPIGSPQRNRWLGNRPRSGLWKRKDGRHGRKIKPPKPVKIITAPTKFPLPPIQMTMTP